MPANRVRPAPLCGRKGGVIDQVQALKVQDVQDRWQRYYKPQNATLILAGAFDPAKVKQAMTTYFGSLPAGEAAPKPEEPGQPKWGTSKEVAIKPLPGQDEPMASLAYAVPAP